MIGRIVGMTVVLALVFTGCGDDDAAGTSGETLRIEGAWARTSPTNADAGAAYLRITSPQDDSLLVVAVPSSVARRAEIHETVMAGEGDDTMTMFRVERIDLPAGETVALEPGGYHVMLLNLVDPLEAGETFEMTLTFLNAGELTIVVEVRDEAP